MTHAPQLLSDLSRWPAVALARVVDATRRRQQVIQPGGTCTTLLFEGYRYGTLVKLLTAIVQETHKGNRIGTIVTVGHNSKSVRASLRSRICIATIAHISNAGRWGVFHRRGPPGDVIPIAPAAGTLQRPRRGLIRCPRHPPADAAGAREGEREAAQCRGVGRPNRGGEAVPACSFGEGE